MNMYGVFGGYTRWAVVFLIIFVLFFLLVPGHLCVPGTAGVSTVAYAHGPMKGGYNMMGGTMQGYGYESST